MLKDHENNNYQPNLGSNNCDLRNYKLDSLVPSKNYYSEPIKKESKKINFYKKFGLVYLFLLLLDSNGIFHTHGFHVSRSDFDF